MQHIFAVHLKKVRYACNTCNYKSYYLENGKKHLKTHKDTVSECLFIECEQCQTQVDHKKNELCLNEADKTIIIPQYKCATCDYKTFKKRYLKAHTKECEFLRQKTTPEILSSKVTRLQSCEDCEYTTTNHLLMSRHKRLRHGKNGFPVFNCNLCEYETEIGKNLKRHKKLVHSEYVKVPRKELKDVQSCPECDYKTSNNKYMACTYKPKKPV